MTDEPNMTIVAELVISTTEMLCEYQKLTKDLNERARAIIERLELHREQYKRLGNYIAGLESVVASLPKEIVESLDDSIREHEECHDCPGEYFNKAGNFKCRYKYCTHGKEPVRIPVSEGADKPEERPLNRGQKAALKTRECPACHKTVKCLGFNNHKAKHMRKGEWPSEESLTEEPVPTSPICEKPPEPEPAPTKLHFKNGMMVPAKAIVEAEPEPEPEISAEDQADRDRHARMMANRELAAEGFGPLPTPVPEPKLPKEIPYSVKGHKGGTFDKGRHCSRCGLSIPDNSPKEYCDKCWDNSTKRPKRAYKKKTHIN